MLAATIALVAGCSFSSPEPGSPNPGDPDAGTDAGTDAAIDAPPAARCSGYGLDLGGHKYRIVGSSMSWMQARASCEADGGYLLKLETDTEDGLAEYVINEQPEIWIGIHDTDGDGTYRWTDGSTPTFTNWDGGAPGAASPDCVMKNTSSSNGRWYTRSCTDSRPAVCECNP
jgi:hypothetical protein